MIHKEMTSRSKSQISKQISEINLKFEDFFGIPEWRRKDPLDELILTILSQNTNDRNRDRAYGQLRRAFPEWNDVLQADVTLIEASIRSAGLSRQKSGRIKGVLQWIESRFGGMNLDPLRVMNDDDVITLLTEQKGVGVKTAAVLLAFSLDRDLCPVDTHVHRIAKRLGWVHEGASAEAAFHIIRPLTPVEKASTFHLNLLKFGRQICHARKPECLKCPVWDYCMWESKSPK